MNAFAGKRSAEAFPGGISVSHLRVYDSANLAVEGFLALRAELEKGGSLEDFYSHAVRLVRPKESAWRGIWEDGPLSTIQRTRYYLDALKVGASDYLIHGRVFEIPVDPEHEDRKLGMCGTLRPYLPEGEMI